jgi:hypothetical protein
VVVIVPEPASPSPFVWARGVFAPQRLGDNAIGQAQAEAAGLTATGAGNKYSVLYTAATLTEVEPRAGVYDFDLAQGQAYFAGNGATNLPASDRPELAQLDAATLRMDFGRQTFDTHLAMSYQPADQQPISAQLDLSGAIDSSNGYFGAQNPAATSTVSGAVSANGAHAAMAFTQQVPLGTFTGTTDFTKK